MLRAVVRFWILPFPLWKSDWFLPSPPPDMIMIIIIHVCEYCYYESVVAWSCPWVMARVTGYARHEFNIGFEYKLFWFYFYFVEVGLRGY